MRARSPNSKIDDYPGPGFYYNDKSLIGGPDSIKYTMREKKEGNPDNHYPGPADYSANDGLTH